MRRIPGREVAAEIVPGEGVGESMIEVTRKGGRRFALSLSLDNYAGQTVGRWQGSAQLAALDLLGANEIISASYNRRVDSPGLPADSRGLCASLSFPLGWWTFGASGSSNRYSQSVVGQVAHFDTLGRQHLVTAFASRTLQRDQASKTDLQASIARRWGRNYIEDVEIGLQRQDVTDLTIALVDRRLLRRVRLDSQIGWRMTADAVNAIVNRGAGAVMATRSGLLALRTNGSIANEDGAIIYSLGDIAITGVGGSGRATWLRNSSATIQAQGDIAIAADGIVNDRTRHVIGQATATTSADNPPPGGYATIPVVGGVLNSQTMTTVTDDVLTTDSGPGRIVAGGNMVVDTGALLNRYSTISAGGSLLINGGPGSAASPAVTNLGLAGTRITETVTETEVWICVDMSGGACHDYDTILRTTPPVTTTQPIVIAPAIISAGGTVSIDARSIDNLTLVGGAGGDYAASADPGGVTGAALTGAGGAVSASGVTGVAIAGVDPTAIALDPVIVPGLTPATIGLALTPLAAQNPGSPPVFALNLGGLFRFAGATAQYLVETDPAFAGYGHFLSSDYFLTRLGYDPSRVQRRLGDALYEQQLITSQLVGQAGSARLAGYGDNEAQYRALMDAGVLVAQAFGLAPGIGLSAEQMATLTTSIVLLVEVEVIGPDGKPVKVLAPRVYLARVDRRDVNGAAVIAGDDLRLRTADALTNSGVIRADTSSVVDAGSIANRGTIDFGATGFVRTGGDFVSSGIIQGGNLSMQIGGDFRLEPLTSSSTVATSWVGGKRYFEDRTTTTVLNRPATMTLTGDLTAHIGGVFGVVGSDMAVGGDLTVFAREGFDIRSAVDSQQTDYAGRQGSTRYTGSASSETNRLATIQVGGDAAFGTDGAFAVTGGVVDAGGALSVAADTIAVTGVKDVADYEHDAVTKKTGLLSSTKTATHDEAHDETIVRSTLSGDTIATRSTSGTTVLGSNIVASNGIDMASGGDMTLGAMAAHDSEAHSISTKKSGISLAGDGVFAGVAKTRSATTTESVTHTGSLIGSAEGDVTLAARQGLTIAGSQVVGTGTTTLSGTNVTIENVTDTVDTTSLSKSSSAGVSIGVYETVSGAVNSVAGLPGRVTDGAAGGVPQTVVTGVSETVRTVRAVMDALTNTAGVTAHIGFSKSKSTSETRADIVSGSTVTGHDVLVSADRDATVRGSDVSATDDLMIDAGRDILLESAQNRIETETSSRSAGASVGVQVGVGVGGVSAGASVSASASRSEGTTAATTHTRVHGHAPAAQLAKPRLDPLRHARTNRFPTISRRASVRLKLTRDTRYSPWRFRPKSR